MHNTLFLIVFLQDSDFCVVIICVGH